MAFLLVALAVFLVGIVVVRLRHRRPPATFTASIEEFERNRAALAPGEPPPGRRARKA